MTRSNLYITLSDGTELKCVADSSSAPEQGYIVEQLILPLLSCRDAAKELALLNEHCTMNELRANATYRYHIDLRTKGVRFMEENYNYKTDVFTAGKDLTDRYSTCLQQETDLEKLVKELFRDYSNKDLINRANYLPDFKWDDEGIELNRRRRVSNSAFDYEMRGNTLVILKDNEPNK